MKYLRQVALVVQSLTLRYVSCLREEKEPAAPTSYKYDGTTNSITALEQ